MHGRCKMFPNTKHATTRWTSRLRDDRGDCGGDDGGGDDQPAWSHKYEVCDDQVDFEAERKAMQVKMEAEVQELQTHLK